MPLHHREINNHLSNDPTVHKELPFGASVVGLDADYIKLRVVCCGLHAQQPHASAVDNISDASNQQVAHTTPEYANKFTMFQTRLVIDLLEIMQGQHPASALAHSSTAPAAASSPVTASR